MSYDRITQVRIGGMRCIADLALDLHGLTVLIGDNGSGKSTLLEAFELLRQAAKPVNYVNDILEQSGLPCPEEGVTPVLSGQKSPPEIFCFWHQCVRKGTAQNSRTTLSFHTLAPQPRSSGNDWTCTRTRMPRSRCMPWFAPETRQGSLT